MRIALIYHFFAHYRAPVMRELLNNSKHEYVLVGDVRATDPTIKAWVPNDRSRLVVAPGRRICGVYWQSGVLRQAMASNVDVLILLGNAAWPSTWLAAILARLRGKRVLFWTHGWIQKETGVKRLVRNTFYRLAHGLLLYGHMAKMIGIAEGFRPEKLYVIYNSLDTATQREARAGVAESELADIRRSMFDQAERPIVMCSSRLTKVRRLDLLIDAAARLAEAGQPVNLLLVGDGPERQSLEAYAAEKGVWAKFYGACYDEHILARLTMASHLTVAPGKVGLTAMQSLGFGTPVVTHADADNQMPEWEAVVPGRTGGFFTRGDVGSLADAIRPWIDRPLNAQVRARCYEMIDRFYNPGFQRTVIDQAVEGQPADDLFWLKS